MNQLATDIESQKIMVFPVGVVELDEAGSGYIRIENGSNYTVGYKIVGSKPDFINTDKPPNGFILPKTDTKIEVTIKTEVVLEDTDSITVFLANGDTGNGFEHFWRFGRMSTIPITRGLFQEKRKKTADGGGTSTRPLGANV